MREEKDTWTFISAIAQIRPTGEHGFVTAAQDDHMFVWNSSTGSLATVLRGNRRSVEGSRNSSVSP